MSETSTRFEQRAGEPYAHCIDCEGTPFETKELASEHMHETFITRTSGTSGHRIRVTNPNRGERIGAAVDSIIQDAIDGAIEAIGDLTYGRRGGLPDATTAEITEALRNSYDGFGEAWDEYLEENGGDDA